MIQCGEHGQLVPGFIVCVHVLRDRATIQHYVEPTAGGGPEDLGEALCAACAATSEENRNVDDYRLICGGCLKPFVDSQRPQ